MSPSHPIGAASATPARLPLPGQRERPAAATDAEMTCYCWCCCSCGCCWRRRHLTQQQAAPLHWLRLLRNFLLQQLSDLWADYRSGGTWKNVPIIRKFSFLL